MKSHLQQKKRSRKLPLYFMTIVESNGSKSFDKTNHKPIFSPFNFVLDLETRNEKARQNEA
jgi:hypothetical protein